MKISQPNSPLQKSWHRPCTLRGQVKDGHFCSISWFYTLGGNIPGWPLASKQGSMVSIVHDHIQPTVDLSTKISKYLGHFHPLTKLHVLCTHLSYTWTWSFTMKWMWLFTNLIYHDVFEWVHNCGWPWVISFPDPECAPTKEGSGDNVTVSPTFEGCSHNDIRSNC